MADYKFKPPLTGATVEAILLSAQKGEVKHFTNATKPTPATISGPVWIDGKLYWSDGVTFKLYANVVWTATDMAAMVLLPASQGDVAIIGAASFKLNNPDPTALANWVEISTNDFGRY